MQTIELKADSLDSRGGELDSAHGWACGEESATIFNLPRVKPLG